MDVSEYYKTRGKKRKGIIAACVYSACKENNVPRDPKEIAEMFDIKLKDISAGIRTIYSVSKMSEKNENKQIIKIKQSSLPQDYIGRFCGSLGIHDKQFVRFSCIIANFVFRSNVCGSATPPSIASSVI